MDIDIESSDGDSYDGPRLYGLDALDFDAKYARLAGNPVLGQILGLKPHPKGSNIIQPVSMHEVYRLFQLDLDRQRIRHLLFNSVWHTIASSLLRRLLTFNTIQSWVGWHFRSSKAGIIGVHSCLLLLVYSSIFKFIVIELFRSLTRFRRAIIDPAMFPAVIIYCTGCLISYNIRWILCQLKNPVMMLLVGLLTLSYFGIFQWAVARCKVFFMILLDRLWLSSSRLIRSLSSSYRNYFGHYVSLNAASPYRYTKLGTAEIRLLQLRRAHPFSNWTTSLKVVSIADKYPYEALSYTWGDTTITCFMTIDDRRIRITRNASEALHALAPFWGTRLIWIDSICINQGDPVEKGEQVAAMDVIYRQAIRTLAWLGDSPQADLAVLHLRRLQRTLSGSTKTDDADEDTLKDGFEDDFDLKNYGHWHALSGVLAHQYWNRVWITQEIAVSSEIVILYGIHSFPLKLITELVSTIWNHPKIRALLEEPWKAGILEAGAVSNYHNIRMMCGFRNLVQRDRLTTLYDAVCSSCLSSASDPRDRLYAFYNISTCPSGAGLEPDYTISAQEVYIRFTKHYLSANLLHFMETAGHSQDRRLPNLPSWVPDFSSSENVISRGLRMIVSSEDEYFASEETTAIFTFDANNRIRMKGVFIDRVDCVTSRYLEQSWLDSSNRTPYSTSVLAWHEEAIALATNKIPLSYRSYKESRRQAFLRTLIGDRDRHGKEAPVIYKSYYKSWDECSRLVTEARKESEKKIFIEAEEFFMAMVRTCQYRRFGITSEGYMVIVPRETKDGDIVCLISGLQMPVVLRPVDAVQGTEGEIYELVGLCYCHGVMMGEVIRSEPIFRDFIIQ